MIIFGKSESEYSNMNYFPQIKKKYSQNINKDKFNPDNFVVNNICEKFNLELKKSSQCRLERYKSRRSYRIELIKKLESELRDEEDEINLYYLIMVIVLLGGDILYSFLMTIFKIIYFLEVCIGIIRYVIFNIK